MAILDGKEPPGNASERIREGFEFFEGKLANANADLDLIYRGIKKLVAVNVSLKRGEDDPQMIFESLNSTGLDLTQADLIRNFVLMRQDEQLQTRLYQDYWQPIEAAFGVRYRSDFDKFVRDYLTLQLKPSKQLKADEIYQHFRTYLQPWGQQFYRGHSGRLKAFWRLLCRLQPRAGREPEAERGVRAIAIVGRSCLARDIKAL